MAKLKQISKAANYTKLFVGDTNHIRKMVSEFKSTDKRFESQAAIRYYVHLGIIAESATEDLSNSLNHSIIKNSIKQAVEKQLSGHSAHIEKLQNLIIESTARNARNYSDIARRATSIETKVDGGFEAVIKLLHSIRLSGEDLRSTGEQSLRNLIVLRSIFYVFLLGYKTGRIASGTEDLFNWSKLIILAHERANKLSMREVKLLTSETLEATGIQKMAGDIFREITSQPQPNTV